MDTDRPTASFDPYALPPEAVEQPPRGFLRTLRQIGPGLILAGSIVGTGELIATTNVGAKVGFVLLWLVLISCFIKVFVQAELGRYAISSGDTTMAAFGRLPGPGALIGWWFVIMTLLTQMQLGAMVGGVGQAFHMALPGVSPWLADVLGNVHSGMGQAVADRPEVPWAVLTAVGTSILLAVGTYNLVERISTIMVVTFTLMTVLCVALLPAADYPIPWDEVAAGFTFSIPPEAVFAALAMFGITGVGGSELVAYPYWCIEKGYARKTGPRPGAAQPRVDDPPARDGSVLEYARAAVPDAPPLSQSPEWLARARGWIRVMFVDVWLCLGIYTLATLAFYALGATVLHNRSGGAGLPPRVGDVLNELSAMYAPVMGPELAKLFIVVGVFAVLYSTLYSATASNSRAIADFLSVNRLATFRTPKDRVRWVRLLCIIFPIVDLFLFIAYKDPVKMVVFGGIAQAITLPMIAAAAVWLRYNRTDRRLVRIGLWDVFLWLSMLGLFAAAAYLLWKGITDLTTPKS